MAVRPVLPLLLDRDAWQVRRNPAERVNIPLTLSVIYCYPQTIKKRHQEVLKKEVKRGIHLVPNRLFSTHLIRTRS